MKKITGYVYHFAKDQHKPSFLVCAFLTAVAVFCNYHFGLNSFINGQTDAFQYLYWFLVFLAAFGSGYLVIRLMETSFQPPPAFYVLLILAPALFSWKMVYDPQWNLSPDPLLDAYWNRVLYWPFKVVVITGILALTWRLQKPDPSVYGLRPAEFNARPYLLMLLIMLPLIALASTQPDFLATYPKLKHISFLEGKGQGWYKVLYELAYGSDFLTIEVFFRGFLVLAFAKWFGRQAILPMAMFYCTIHFGKPLGECISSFFGGMLLGIVTYHTRTIYGGLIVHVGIAWMMELGGYLGNQ